ncbi:MAG TPA: EAL domain-containing protein [Candidatus Baltobacteraceae bacterium]|nr:EAL domain-containing protein [Candidatus Baltobacteraceae bacterium]
MNGIGVEPSVHDDDVERLTELFTVATESRRPVEELLRVFLSAALAVVGADVALVADPIGTLVAYAAAGVDEKTVRALAAETMRARVPESFSNEKYVARLPGESGHVFALRWPEHATIPHRSARALAGAVARLLARGPEAQHVEVRETANDPLTDLPGRSATIRFIDDALAAARRTGSSVGILFIDLDGFKAVNDTFGHAVGDQTLIEAARRMKESTRRGDFVGRIGGDEFVAVLGVAGDELEMVEAAERFLERIRVEVQDGAYVRVVQASIGVAVSPTDGNTPEELLQHADEALYAAKESGGQRVRWYRDAVSQDVRARREFRAGLRDADFERDFMFCFQPIVSTATMRVVGAETLVRWRHPTRGWLTPRTFLETRGGVLGSSALDLKVIHAVAETLRHTTVNGHAGDSIDVRIHVNVSNASDSVWQELESALADIDDVAARVAIEIRDVATLAESNAAAFLRRLRRLGIPIGLDGFGASATSLQNLAAVPLDFLKIDPKVTRPAAHDPQARRVARAAIGVAQSLQIPAIADGVEDREQAQWAVSNGVEQLQGYLIAQPMTAPDFADWLRHTKAGIRNVWQ